MSDDKNSAWVRAAAAQAVDEVVSKGRSLDVALANAESRVSGDDRSLLRMLCFGTLRNHWRLQEWANSLLDRPLKKRDSVISALLAVGLFQLTDTRIPDHAAVSQTVEAARLLRRPKHAGLLNAVLRRFGRDKLANVEAISEEARHNHPRWLIDLIRSDWPDDWEHILAANNDRAAMWLRVNAQRAATSEYAAEMKEAGSAASSLGGADQALKLDEAMPVAELPGFHEGRVSVQDAAAQIAAPWLLEGLKGRILDACAAPGGKSAHLLELGGAEITLTSVDKDVERLENVSENLRRLGLAATVLPGDASKPSEWWNGEPFDGILLDAPCSASGVIRRHPDIKLLRRETDIAELSRLQSALLAALWPLLKPNGRLLYVTCSVLAAENDAVVARFLDSTADARENDMLPNNNIRDVMSARACGYQILPGTAGLDGFYFACLEKVS
jgi:16S rRNA (cytosine967-C5)-methyltransferase